MKVLSHPSSRRPFAGKARACAAGFLLLLCGATTGIAWDRYKISKNPTAAARLTMQLGEQDADRIAAVVIVLRDVRQSIEQLRLLASSGSGKSAENAANALDLIRAEVR